MMMLISHITFCFDSTTIESQSFWCRISVMLKIISRWITEMRQLMRLSSCEIYSQKPGCILLKQHQIIMLRWWWSCNIFGLSSIIIDQSKIELRLIFQSKQKPRTFEYRMKKNNPSTKIFTFESLNSGLHQCN